jgi:hypothetical protein
MLYAIIKKAVFRTAIIMTILLCFGYMAWRQMLWKNEAMSNASFAATVLALNNYHKGKFIKYELVVKDKPELFKSKQHKFEGPFVIEDWTGYTDPMFRFSKSPSVFVAEEFVKAYNNKMNNIISDPNRYEQSIREEINYWKEKVLIERPTK